MSPNPNRSTFILQWHINEKCNLRCRHCYQQSYEGADLEWDKVLSVLGQFQSFLRTLSVKAGRRIHGHINLTGGEPFLYPRLFDLLTRLTKESPALSYALLSNGTLIKPELAGKLKSFRPAFVQVSVEGSPATHEAIRGTGSYAQALAGLQALKAAGIKTMISFTAQRGNYREYPLVAKLARKLKVEKLWVDRLIPEGCAADSTAKTLEPAEARELFQLMLRERKRWTVSRTDISMQRALQFLALGGRPYRCTAGDNLLALLPDGTLYPCRRLPVAAGNVFKDGLERAYFENPLLKALRERRHSCAGCQSCFYRQTCNGGLRCLALAQTGSLQQADPGCWLAQASDTGKPISDLAAGNN